MAELILGALFFFVLGYCAAYLRASRSLEEIVVNIDGLIESQDNLNKSRDEYVLQLEKNIKFYQDVENYSYSRY